MVMFTSNKVTAGNGTLTMNEDVFPMNGQFFIRHSRNYGPVLSGRFPSGKTFRFGG